MALLLRIHCVQLSYDRSDLAMQDALYDAVAAQRFVGPTTSDPRPDETTILHFRLLLERHHMSEGPLAEITQHLAMQGFHPGEGRESVPVCEVALRLRAGAVSGVGQEPPPAVPVVRVRQSAAGGARRAGRTSPCAGTITAARGAGRADRAGAPSHAAILIPHERPGAQVPQLFGGFLAVSAGLGSLAALLPQPLPLLHVQVDDVAEALAYGAALLLQHLLHLLARPQGYREGDGLSGRAHFLSFCLPEYDNVIPLP